MAGYIGTQPVPQATQTRDSFTCTAGQTSFATSGFTPNFLDVYLNGVKLTATDYTASNGSDVVLASGAAAGDVLEVVAFTTFDVVTDTITAAGTALTLDRTGSDGTIIDLKKDGSTVGSIGTSGGLLNIGSGDTGLLFAPASDVIIPSNPTDTANGGRDNVIDLGNTYNRFKDLYLSGGVYLGGTGSANKLDDYEEGTFTPYYGQGVNSPVYTNTQGSYTKIGDLVTFTLRIQLTSGTGNSSQLEINGLPFTSAGGPPGTGTKSQGGVTINYQAGFKTDFNVSLHVPGSAAEIRFYNQTSGGTFAGSDATNVRAVLHLNGFYYTA